MVRQLLLLETQLVVTQDTGGVAGCEGADDETTSSEMANNQKADSEKRSTSKARCGGHSTKVRMTHSPTCSKSSFWFPMENRFC